MLDHNFFVGLINQNFEFPSVMHSEPLKQDLNSEAFKCENLSRECNGH